jgi:hypothetical protein
MSDDLRRYQQGVRFGLATLCGGTCYWPDCPEPVIRFVGEDPIVNLQIAHIAGAVPGGPRYVLSMTDEQRRSFANLILLCHPHHTTVDKLRPQDFPIPTLREWKASRETVNQEALSRLREVTPDALQTMLTDALNERDERLEAAIEQLRGINAEAAQLLHGLLNEVQALRRAALTEEFIRAANRLHPEILDQFGRAARHLDMEVLQRFAEASRRLPDR